MLLIEITGTPWEEARRLARFSANINRQFGRRELLNLLVTKNKLLRSYELAAAGGLFEVMFAIHIQT